VTSIMSLQHRRRKLQNKYQVIVKFKHKL